MKFLEIPLSAYTPRELALFAYALLADNLKRSLSLQHVGVSRRQP